MDPAVIGFDDPDDLEKECRNGSSLASKQSGNSKKSGGFQSMGLSFPVLKGIQKRGYKIPTPIQRKTIPVILEGRDIVAMARTGSGKTACFLVPLLEKLKSRTGKSGARGLILSPTRELALQTLKFFKELGRFTDLQAAAILGGDSMDNQFSTIHGNPDVIVATPGRFLHICVEMELKLNSIEYIVFDEADRLFEMGFGEQLREVVNRLPESRQTVLFSATLPKVLVEFAKAGLTNPVLIRLDVESKLPDELKLVFLCCRPEEKEAVLLSMLQCVIKRDSQTVIFAATSHHVEYLHKMLDIAGISNTYIYSNLDPSARKINAAKFQMAKASVLIVTDVAARGIDIPQLDNVINYNFPATSKLFVHRVGRCARAGRSGTAYSLISNEEHPYLLDLHLFLSRPLNFDPQSKVDGVIGRISQDRCDEARYQLLIWHDTHTDLANMKKVCNNAYRKYIRSRPGASVESVKRMKDINFDNVAVHPDFSTESTSSKMEISKNEFLGEMKKYRPKGNIFEIGQTSKSVVYNIMKNTRKKNLVHITNYKRKHEDKEGVRSADKRKINLVSSTEDDIADTFQNILEPRKKKQKLSTGIDKEYYIPYTSSDHHTEQGLSVNSFHQEAEKSTFDLTGDSEDMFKMQKKMMRWDRKKKKMVGVADEKMGKIRTESGVWIPATYKSNRYSQWKDKTKMASNNDGSDEEDNSPKNALLKQSNTHWGRHNMKIQLKGKSELKHTEQIMKARLISEKNKLKNKKKKKKGKKKSKRSKK